MKKFLSISSSKIFIFCFLGLGLTLGGFWHHEVNELQLDKMNVMKEALGTCFNRVSQSFTGIMIKDVRSNYLSRDFMSLSDECLNEASKEAVLIKHTAKKGYENLKLLMSEVHWFHEKILKVHSPMLAGVDLNPNLGSLMERYAKMENLKLDLIDEIDAAKSEIAKVQVSDKALMGTGLVIFVLSLSLLALVDFNRRELRKEIEKEALNFLKAGESNISAIVDRLVDRALLTQGLPVTAQIFRDYHEEILEKSPRASLRAIALADEKSAPQEVIDVQEETFTNSVPIPRSSLKEILVSLQAVHSKEAISLSEVRDVALAINFEDLEQVLNAAYNKLSGHRVDNKKILIANQIHSDRSVITMHLSGSTFSASELEFAGKPDSNSNDVDMNLVILKEMAASVNLQWTLENKTDRQGKITGMSIRFVVARAPKDSRDKNLVSVMKGKKKDLARELMN